MQTAPPMYYLFVFDSKAAPCVQCLVYESWPDEPQGEAWIVFRGRLREDQTKLILLAFACCNFQALMPLRSPPPRKYPEAS